MESNFSPAIRRFWLATIATNAVVVAIMLMTRQQQLFGIHAPHVVGLIGMFAGFYTSFRFSPRCPDCDHGIYSWYEVRRVPVLLKLPRPKNCLRCERQLRG